MEKTRVRIYADYKSPYAFVADRRLFELEEKRGVELEWSPYTLRVAEFMGTVEERRPHFWRKVRYPRKACPASAPACDARVLRREEARL
jgi:2-hydroxychromene-2-carboxylate isomerase